MHWRKKDPGIFPYYYHREPIRGSALFVVNQTFKKSRKRQGAEKDLSHLQSVFLDKLGFQQLNKGDDFNLSLSKLDNVIKKAISKDFSDTDFFVFAISTHGKEKRSMISQQFEHALLCANEEYKFTMDIINSFSKCLTLAGKPKIFVIQACRNRSGSNEEKGSIMIDEGHKFALLSKAEERDSKSNMIDNVQADDNVEANNKVDIKKEANTEEKADTKKCEKGEMYAKASKRKKNIRK